MPLPSKRDREEVRARLVDWLTRQLPPGAAPNLSKLDVPEGTGMSSETFLFDAQWDEDGQARGGSYVVRMSPNMDDYPIFPEYDLSLQVNCLSLVADRSDVPVPKVAWYEPDASVLDYPFYVMERVDGDVPADIPPYLFDGWLCQAAPQDRAALQRSTVEMLAKLHAIDVTGEDAAFLNRAQYGTSALEQHLNYQRAYYDWAREGQTYPILEKTFDWLEARRPDDTRPAVLNWGDSRVGNVMYRDFAPVAVFDWEMAALGAPEVDLTWMISMNAFFQQMGEANGLTGLPDFLNAQDVIAAYEGASGRPVEHFDWYYVFAVLRFGIISIRTSVRGIGYGQMEPPATRDEYISNRFLLEPYID